MNTKKTLLGFLATAAFMMVGFSFFASAAKPADNANGAQKIGWNLSGAVMPVPPYGLADIAGSDVSSKLIFNRPNGETSGMLGGVMKGLHPNTEYTVYLSNPYSKYVPDVSGVTGFDFEYMGSHYVHSAALSQSGLSVTGNGGYPFGGPFTYAWSITGGSVVGNHVHLVMDYTAGADCTMTMDGDVVGNTVSGTWSDDCDGARTGTWTSTGVVTRLTGDTGWTGLLAGTTPFTFVTNAEGSGNWHYNFKGTMAPSLSVWINEAGTVLISDTIIVQSMD